MDTSTNKLVNYILKWWKEHECDTTGECGDYNVYDEEPEFVSLAKTIKDKELGEPIEQGDLEDWYMNSIDETKDPVWTIEHLEELLNDFILIPKESDED